MGNSEYIEVVSGAAQGTRVEVVGALTIGRSPENGLQLNDMQVSRRHAVIQQTPAGTIVRDLQSGNGTFVGERRILEYRLKDGDTIRVGPMELRFDVVASQRAPQPQDSGVRFQEEDSAVQAASVENVYQTFVRAPEAATADQLRELQSRLLALYEANQIIASERDLGRLFERVLDQLFALVPAHNGVILLKDRDSGELETAHVKSGSGTSEVRISTTIVRRAFEENQAVLTFNAADDARFGAGQSIITQNICSAMAAPMRHQNETLGVIYVDTRGTKNAFAQRDLELLVALAAPAAIAIRNAQNLDRIQRGYKETMMCLANAIEMRDHYTIGHTWRVTNFALVMARELGWDDEKLAECEMGGVLHDIGKIAVSDTILGKPTKLTDDEYASMKVHPERGARLMQDVSFLVPLIPYALYHHERYDGKGYPFGLAGDDIPIEGRLVAVADTFDAMTSNRPYRRGLDPELALAEIEKGKGQQFDPRIVDILVKCYRDGKIQKVMQDYYKDSKASIACPFCSTYVKLTETCKVDDILLCGVCHSRIRLKCRFDAFYGERVAATEHVQQVTASPGE